MKLSAIFPNASQSCQKANPQLLGDMGNDLALGRGPTTKSKLQGNAGRKRGIPNKTEAEFALRLEAMKQAGEILRYEYEGITLRWNGVRYTPDFVVFDKDFSSREVNGRIFTNRLRLIEIKGGFIKGKYERAIERFKHARTYWPEFSFEMHQKKNGQWTRIL